MEGYDYSIFVLGDESGIAERIKGTGFLTVTKVNSIDDRIKQSYVVIIDKSFDENEIVKAKESMRKNAVIIVVTDKNYAEVIYKSNACVDYVWLRNQTDEELKFRFRNILKQVEKIRKGDVNELFLDTLIDSVPNLIWIKDKRGAHLNVNNYFCKVVGKEKKDIIGRGHYYIWDIEPEEYADGEYVCLETEEIVLKEKKTFLFDEQVKIGNEMRQLKTYKSPIIDEDGVVLGTTGMAYDVTDIENIQVQLEVFLNSIPFPVAVFDKNHRVVNINYQFTNFFKVKKDALIGQSADNFNKLIFNESAVTRNKNGDTLITYSNNGNDTVLLFMHKEITNSFDQITGYMNFYRDVSLQNQYENKLEILAERDELTGLYNRHMLHNHIEQEFMNTYSMIKSIGVMMIDIDYFKNYNDTYGHLAGDMVLNRLGSILLKLSSDKDILPVRYGGEEFLVLFENKKEEFVTNFAQEFFKELKVPQANQTLVTCSIGIYFSNEFHGDIIKLIDKADKALYEAKNNGRDRICFSN